MRGLHQMTLAFNFSSSLLLCGGHKVIELPAHLIRVLNLGTHWTRWWTTTWWRNLIIGGKPQKGPFLKGLGLNNIPEREMSGLNLNIVLASLILGFVVGGISLASIILLFSQLKNSWNKEWVKTISSLSLLHEDQWVYLKHWASKILATMVNSFKNQPFLAGFPNSETYRTQPAGLCPKELLALV